MNGNTDPGVLAADNAVAQHKPGIDWADPSVPAGDGPALPRWPLYLSLTAFVLWIAFLVAMAIVRVSTTAN